MSPMQQAGSQQAGLRRRESPFAFHFQQEKLQCRAEGRLTADECDEEEGAGAALVAAEHEVGVQRHVVAGTDDCRRRDDYTCDCSTRISHCDGPMTADIVSL